MISDEDYRRLELITGLLLPGDATAPAAADLPELRALLARAISAVGGEASTVEEALTLLPLEPTWESLEELDATRPEIFEALAAVTAGAYFMAPTALDAIGYPHGPRKRSSDDRVVAELETGILEPVLQRSGMVRAVPT